MSEKTIDFDDIIIDERKPAARRAARGGIEVGDKPSRWLLVVPAIAATVALWFVFARFYTDYLWFSSVGFAGVFSTIWTTTALVGSIIGIGAGVLTWLNLRSAANSASVPPSRPVQLEDAPAALPILKRAPLIAAIFAGLLAALTALGAWETVLRFFYQVPFGTADPLFGRDIAFYVFTLPALDWISTLLLLLLVFNLIGGLVPACG